VNDHPLTVDVADLKVCDLRPASAGGIERHQQDAVKGHLRRIDQTCDLFLAEHMRQVQNLLRIGRLGRTPASLQDLDIEEAQCSKPLRHGVRRQLPFGEHGGLILANVLQSQPVGRTMEVPRKVLHRADVSVDG